jgi:hypothetical protein
MPTRPPPAPPVDASVEQPSEEYHTSECTFRHVTVLIGAFAANIVSFGWVISSGFFFEYYRTQLFASEGTFALAWLNGLGFSCLYAVSLPLAWFCSSSTFGPQPTMWLGAFIDLLGLCLLALASNLAEVLILQAFVSPL